jgi:hypothetical protein
MYIYKHIHIHIHTCINICIYLLLSSEEALLVSESFQATLRAQDQETTDAADGDEVCSCYIYSFL